METARANGTAIAEYRSYERLLDVDVEKLNEVIRGD